MKLKEQEKEYLVPVALIICSFILGVSYITVQAQKQNSIERQQEREIEEQIRQEELEKQEKEKAEMDYNLCVYTVEKKYWSYVELNKITKDEVTGAIKAPMWVWDEAEKRKQQDIDNCRKKYLE